MQLLTPAAPPVFVVAGLGRCGTTLVMNMLAAGGMPCAGEAPAYEPEQVNQLAFDPDWFAAQAGKAVKLLDPHKVELPPVRMRGVWLGRDPREQARSQGKFSHLVGGLPRPSRRQVRSVQERLVRERRAAIATLWGACSAVEELRFEYVLAQPGRCANDLAAFFSEWFDLDVDRMAAVARPRDPACAPGLEMELQLLQESGRAA